MGPYKRILAAILFFAIALTGVTACGKEETVSQGEVSDLSGEQHFDIGDILSDGATGDSSDAESSETVSKESSQGDPSDPSDPSQGGTSEPSQSGTSEPSDPSQGGTSEPSQSAGEFVVGEKKYTFQGNDLLLLSVENKTGSAYDVTVNGQYLDASGNVIKEESQTYVGFPAGWQNYFIFRPKATFDGFTYDLSAKPCDLSDKVHFPDGDPLTPYVSLTYSKQLHWQYGGPFNGGMRDLVFDFTLTNRHTKYTIAATFHALVLDANGEIYATDYEYGENASGVGNFVSGTLADPTGGIHEGKAYVILGSQRKDQDETIPAEIQGHITVIFAVVEVVHDAKHQYVPES